MSMHIRVEFFGDEIDRITEDRHADRRDSERTGIYRCFSGVPLCCADGYESCEAAKAIEEELAERVEYFKSEDKLLEAQRIAERTNFDVEMLSETGFCSGVENYSRHLAGMPAGSDTAYTDGLFRG